MLERGRANRHAFEIARPLGPAQREIEVGLGEIDRAVAADQLKPQPRVGRAERGKPRRKPRREHVAWARDRVDLARLPGLHCLDRFLEPQETLADGIEPGGRLVGQLKAFGGAAEQHHAEQVFERANLLANRGRGDGQFVGRARERQVPRCGVEHAQAVERQVRPLHARTSGHSGSRSGTMSGPGTTFVRRAVSGCGCGKREKRDRHFEQIGLLPRRIAAAPGTPAHRVMALHRTIGRAKRAA